MNTDRNLLFGALAFQNEYIDLAQFAAICRAWAADKSRPLADLLVERGWITIAVQAVLDEIVERKLKRYGGDAHATLGAVADGQVRDAIREVSDPDISHSVSTLPPAAGHVLVETVSKPAEGWSRYTLTRLHAEGGIGRVWLARDEDLNRDVALKELLPHRATHPDAWRRFMKEAQITGQLEHPNIVPFYELARRPGDDQPFYTMRFVRGQTLRDAIAEYHTRRRNPRRTEFIPLPSASNGMNSVLRPQEHDRLELHRLLNALVSVCHAIAYAHSRGVVHRDLKPANVVLGGFGEVLVLDWGIAKVAGATDAEASTLGFSAEAQATATQTGALLGTPEYMAPEQAEGRSELIDARTDIYGLGGILFAIVTGQAPRRGKDTIEVLSQLLDNPTPRVRSVDPHAPAALDAICAMAMAKDPADRYASASELAAEVERYLSDEPVSAYREPWPARLGRWTRRHRTGTQAAAVILLAVTIVSVLATVLVNEQRRRAEAAEQAERKERTRADGTAERERQERERADETAKRERQERDRADAKQNESRRHLYIAHMNLAQNAWESARAGTVFEMLGRYRLPSHGHDPRGFEWYYWDRLCHTELRTLEGHVVWVPKVCFSRDGRWIASAGYDKTAKLWNSATGELIRSFRGHKAGVSSVSLSPDSSRLVSASWDGIVKVWDVERDHSLLSLNGHIGECSSVLFSPDGKRFASAGEDQTVRVWDVETGQNIWILKGHVRRATSASFSPDGRWLASASDDGTVKVWDMEFGQEIRTLKGHSHVVWDVAFSPDGRYIASASEDKTARVWDAKSGQPVFTLKGHNSRVSSVSFSPDGRLATGSTDMTVRLWNLATGEEIRTLRGHIREIWCVSFSADGRQLASSSGSYELGEIKVWDTTSSQEMHTMKGHAHTVRNVAFNVDGRYIASASDDGTVKVWNTETNQQICILNGHRSSVSGVSFAPTGQLASASADKTIKLWDVEAGGEIQTLIGHAEGVQCVSFSPDGRSLASAGDDNTVRVWDVETGKELHALRGHSRKVEGVSFGRDGRWIASASWDGTVRVWEADTGVERHRLRHEGQIVRGVAFSPDGRWLASAPWDRTVRLWNLEAKWEQRILKGHNAGVYNVTFSPDSHRIASASDDQTVKLWDVATGEEILTLTGHTGPVTSTCFAPDGLRLVSGSADRTVKLWDARPWTPELKAEQEAFSLLRFLCAQRPAKERLIESIRGDATISEPVRRRALELAGTFWERDMNSQASRLVDELFAKRQSKDEVLRAIAEDSTLTESLRTRALELVRQRKE